MTRPGSIQNIERFSRTLHDLRRARGLSVDQVADRTGIARSTLYQYERNAQANPTLDNLLRLAAFFELHALEELFGPLPSRALGALQRREDRSQEAG